jgi:hypothetical protein
MSRNNKRSAMPPISTYFRKLKKQRWFAPPAVAPGAHGQAAQSVDATVRSVVFAAAGRHEERRIPA